ncbi:DNA polymerase/3'-5' exonuclease PolX [Anaerobacillus alkalidiazotrophicus]|uniref:DNA-directed DNA polymerase n=1 Tax=Anaerobacillus alkalidiazotrophicus TaxID=472963 RepID=A0A1S2M4S8_9BACI|nr:DNA polymerase/3'-5' exonuclease PolX [Anaerobacillus alkalidiazotrophicus]OIJ18313.1 DNA polymerase/3'-5' exonuclease PolX [Anaerobacillus alkalidiazotrophicus]OIJ19792.1 DNA polymerase/3'-5' exonuclease PolX [Anaerobacillus alkalidiazotrophicus]
MNKKQVITTLETIALYMEIKGENSFKVSAFRKAAQALEVDERTLEQIDEPAKLKGIGKGTATVIEELKNEGKSSLLEELMNELPGGLIPLLKLPGLGGKKIGKLYQELNVVDVKTLKQVCLDEKVQALAGFGKKTEEKLLAAIEDFGKQPERLPIYEVLPIAKRIEENLVNMSGIIRFSRAGSLRRVRETVKDLDYIIATDDPKEIRDQLLKFQNVGEIIAAGDTKVSLHLNMNDLRLSVDFRLVTENEFATALHHFTGSKDHNVQMRQLAKERGEKISEYGVENIETGKISTFRSEEEFFEHFGLQYIPPEVREGDGEIDVWQIENPLISLDDIRGDMHMHSTWSDGANSILEMAEACREKGYSYIAITDHSKFLKVANGLTVERLKEQHREIAKLNEKWDDFKIFTGIEMDILPDGTLDYDDEVIKEVDFVIASIHSSFSQDRAVIMERLTNALRNHHVDLIAHPTGRLIGRRDGYDVDVDLLVDISVETNTALELNANPHRLDLASHWLKKAQEKGAKIMINTDAHNLDMLNDMKIGVSSARKGWIKKETVINSWDLPELKNYLNRND